MAKFRRILAMVLVMCMFTSALPMQALAAEDGTVIDGPNTETVDGVTTEITTTTTTTTDSETGNVTVTVEIQQSSSGTSESTGAAIESSSTSTSTTVTDTSNNVVSSSSSDSSSTTTTTTTTDAATGNTTEVSTEVVTESEQQENGDTRDFEETTTITTTTDTDGNVVSEKGVTDGSETKTWTEEDAGNGPDVVAPIVPGETTTATGGVTTETVTNPDGSTTTTTTTDRTVTTETTDAEVTVNDSNTGNVTEDKDAALTGPAPVYDSEDGPAKDAAGKDGVFDRNYLSSQKLDYINVNGISIWVDKGTKVIVDVVTPEGAELPEHTLLQDVTVGASVKNWYNSSNSFKKSSFPTGTQYKGGTSMNNIDNWYDSEGNLLVSVPDEGDFRYVGTGEHSKYFVGFMSVVYEKDENGNTVYDKDGNPVIAKLLNSADGNITIDGEPADELLPAYKYDGYSGSRAQNFMLMDKNGNRVYGYCCDLETGAEAGTWYSVSNLEDSDYYASEESEEHIRSIVMNGYWGTSDEVKEDGTYETGSLESIKAKLKAAIEQGEISSTVMVPERNINDNGNVVLGEDGQPIYHEMNILDYLDGLTAGEALLATQAAIWTYANGSTNVANGQDGAILVSPDWYRNHQIGYSKVEGEPLDDAAGARVELLYQWLINLDTKEESTVVINEKNFVEDMTITVHEKVKEVAGETVEAYYDDDTDNDVYNTDLNFKLAFVPGPNDDLLVQVTYTDFDGKEQTVIRRLAGDQQDHAKVDYDEATGSYVLKGLILSENKDFNFDLRLEGTQYLEDGVYVYQAVGGRGASQTFVGVAEGTRNVDVSIGVTIKFDVDENNHVVAERTWHNEYDPGNTPADPGEDPSEFELATADFFVEEEEPQIFRLTNNDGLEEIPEEPVPLAAPVITGDHSALWMAVVLMAMVAMVAINLNDKKRQYETF